MTTAKLFENGRSQAVRLPKEFRFNGDEVIINKIGNVVLLMPKDDEWAGFVAGLSLFTDDFMCNGREDIDHQERESFDIATSRAVARLPILLEWTVPYVKEGGYVIALKGAIYEEEVGESNKALSTLKAKIEEVRTVTLPTLDDKRAILYIKKTGKTPKQYPRKPKEIKDKPLI